MHAEADWLPGLVIGRYDDVAVVQANAAGMDRMLPVVPAFGPRLVEGQSVYSPAWALRCCYHGMPNRC